MSVIFSDYVNSYYCIVILDPSNSSGSRTRGLLVCLNSTVVFVCNTTKNSLVWATSSAQGSNWKYDENPERHSPVTLGNFTLSRDGANATAVNSTAVLTDPVQLSHDGVTLKCTENSPESLRLY